jgi:hypothetical protein
MNAFIAVNEQYSYLDILSLHACKGPCREHTRASLGVARGLSTDSRERLLVRVGNFESLTVFATGLAGEAGRKHA